ncbi:MAG: zinc ribbon domain-containing protein [Planctomycetaceae bacterium]|nr:zinc ribbon domain-containing protein [Planctomycetaceae bacterium]
MPIKFRCPNCRQFLGISPKKAGELTDCPACGRTVRVPNLDGTVSPVPAARIDHRDAQLADALSALSQIGAPADRPAVIAAPRAERAVAATAAPVAVAVPSVQQLPAERLPPEPAPQSSSLDAAPTLLFESDADASEPVRVRRRKPLPLELWITAVALAAALVFLAGFLVGRGVERGTRNDAPVAAPLPAPAEQPAAPAIPGNEPPVEAIAPPVAATGVSGRVTFASGAGSGQPDAGARIIAVPAELTGTPSLSVAGFRAGAGAAERERAVTLVRGAGGDYAIADGDGRYSLQLPAGRFEILFLSRYVPHDETQPADSRLGGLLAACFDQPAALVGSVRIESETIDFDGSPLRLDHAFSR